MTDKELKHLKKVDLLELLLSMSRENERLKQQLEIISQQLGFNPDDPVQTAFQISAALQAIQDAAGGKHRRSKANSDEKPRAPKSISVRIKSAKATEPPVED